MPESQIQPRPMVLSEFAGLVGEWFLADCQPQPARVKLVAASALRPSGLDIRPPFILTFYTPPDVLLSEGQYAMRCGQFGPELIHIAGVIAPPNADAGYYYQAVFN